MLLPQGRKGWKIKKGKEILYAYTDEEKIKIIGKSADVSEIEEVDETLKQTIIIAPENLGNPHGCPFNGLPYEVQFKMSNASDCIELMKNLGKQF